MKIGTVFFWDNLQVDLSGKIKSRWFIYLGKTPYGIDPPRSHLAGEPLGSRFRIQENSGACA